MYAFNYFVDPSSRQLFYGYAVWSRSFKANVESSATISSLLPAPLFKCIIPFFKWLNHQVRFSSGFKLKDLLKTRQRTHGAVGRCPCHNHQVAGMNHVIQPKKKSRWRLCSIHFSCCFLLSSLGRIFMSCSIDLNKGDEQSSKGRTLRVLPTRNTTQIFFFCWYMFERRTC